MQIESKIEKAIHDLEVRFPQYSLRLWLKKNRKKYIFIFLSLLAIVFIFPDFAAIFLFLSLNFAYLTVQLFKLILVVLGAFAKEEKLSEVSELPVYTILLPIYKEEKVLNQLINSIKNLDYPKQLLDVKLIIEEDDKKSLSALEKVVLPAYFDVIKVPLSFPRTKPKACNYALQFARGKYVVVYDAEDKPDSKQLKQAIAKFSISSEDVVCVQARLNFYNHNEDNLTKLFAVEYSILFDYILPGLKFFKLPIPLGGTSNHFILEKLIELGGWDAFNVTEDADLGIRLYDQNYKVALINSVTLEESPINLKAWIIQRSRWIKGHMLTSLLHIKKHKKGIWGLYLFLYFPNLIYIFLPIYILLKLLVLEHSVSDLFWQFNLVIGAILPISYSILVSVYKKWQFSILDYILMIFYYWLLPIAGLRAAWQIFKKPYYWDKTEHGVSKYNEK